MLEEGYLLRLQGLAKFLEVAELWRTRKNQQVKEEREQNVHLTVKEHGTLKRIRFHLAKV